VTKSKDATRHARTRAAHAAETAEDYVEAIAATIAARGACRVMDLTERFGVTHVTVVKILNRLQREGLVQTEARGPVQLTADGARLAQRSKERHKVVYDFLRTIGVSEEVAGVDAEGIEHHVSGETLERFRQIVEARRI
jgi:DtxR family manganese transport transcriptional regulator